MLHVYFIIERDMSLAIITTCIYSIVAVFSIPLITALVVGAIVVNIALFMYLESTRGREIDWLQFNYKYLRRGKV